MNKESFQTLANNGNLDGFSNACLWISVLDYLRYCKEYANINLKSIRDRFGQVFGPNEEFNIEKNGHHDAMEKLAKNFHLTLDFYYYNRQGTIGWIGNKAYSIGFGPNHVPIVAFGGHFELIVSKLEEPCRTSLIKNARDFKRTISDYTPKVYNNKDEKYEETKDIKQIEFIQENDLIVALRLQKKDYENELAKIKLLTEQISKMMEERNQLQQTYDYLKKEEKKEGENTSHIKINLDKINTEITNLQKNLSGSNELYLVQEIKEIDNKINKEKLKLDQIKKDEIESLKIIKGDLENLLNSMSAQLEKINKLIEECRSIISRGGKGIDVTQQHLDKLIIQRTSINNNIKIILQKQHGIDDKVSNYNQKGGYNKYKSKLHKLLSKMK